MDGAIPAQGVFLYYLCPSLLFFSFGGQLKVLSNVFFSGIAYFALRASATPTLFFLPFFLIASLQAIAQKRCEFFFSFQYRPRNLKSSPQHPLMAKSLLNVSISFPLFSWVGAPRPWSSTWCFESPSTPLLAGLTTLFSLPLSSSFFQEFAGFVHVCHTGTKNMHWRTLLGQPLSRGAACSLHHSRTSLVNATRTSYFCWVFFVLVVCLCFCVWFCGGSRLTTLS